jgi:putative copper resistance protein D
VTAVGLTIRWLHLAAGLSLAGIFAVLLLAGRSDRPTARAWEARVLALTRWLAVLLLLSGLAGLAHQAAVITGQPAAARDPASWLRILLSTQYGAVWLLRHGLLLLLAALILLRERERSIADWAAFRIEGWLLGAAGVGAMAWAGHAAAVEPGGLAAALVDALHLVASGTWLGALLPLALLLRAAGDERGADSRPFAVLAVRRFSALALVAMLLIVASGIWNAWTQVADVPALVGTRYGWLVLLKVSLLGPILVLAAVNRKRLLPALSGDGPTVGRPAMKRLARFVALECALGALILAVVSALSVTPPGRHESPWWPFAYRISYEATAGLPGVRTRVLIGSQLALLGVLTAIAGWLAGRRRLLVLPLGGLLMVVGLLVAVPPLTVDAYPTTYRRSSVPYQAISVASGLELYLAHCAVCHGVAGTGDGPGSVGLPRPPADLTAPHTADHTAGDLFWWLTHGIPRAGMPPFGDRLSEEERWDLINFVRALSSAEQARGLSPIVEPDRPWLAAPDFAFAVGPTPGRTLKEFRGRRHVLLVLFTLPGSRPRLSQLAEAYNTIQEFGAEILAVPMDGGGDIIRRLGDAPRILFPVVTEGSPEIARTYALFRRTRTPDGLLPDPPGPPHMEFLIDRQGYIRARWIPAGPARGWSDPGPLYAELQQLNEEAPTAPPPGEHVH